MEDIFDTITDKDIEDLGLLVLLREQDEYCKYILISDKERYFDDRKYACHYEILQMVDKDTQLKHEKDKIYVEIHFEHESNSKCFIPTISALLSSNKKIG